MKIIDKINAAIEEKRTMFSFEYFPPKTDEGKAASLTLQVPIQQCPLMWEHTFNGLLALFI
jgi:hypothetical protein